jgi:hypothetical protein
MQNTKISRKDRRLGDEANLWMSLERSKKRELTRLFDFREVSILAAETETASSLRLTNYSTDISSVYGHTLRTLTLGMLTKAASIKHT